MANRPQKPGFDASYLYQSAFENSASPLVITDLDRNLILVNRAFCDLLGYSRTELLAMNVADYCHPDDIDQNIEMGNKLERGDITDFNLENRYNTKDGRELWVKTAVSVERDEQCNAQFFLMQISNISHSRNIQEQLEYTSQFFDSIFENIPAMIFVKDAKQLCFIKVNSYLEKLTGTKRKDLLGKSDFDFFPEDQARFFQEKDRQVLADRKILEIAEEPIQTPFGERWLNTLKVPLFDEKGKPAYLLGIARDITESRRTTQELKDSQEQLLALHQLSTELQHLAFVGGWELTRDNEIRWTDGIYLIHEVPIGKKIPLDEAINFYPPHERERIAEIIRAGFEQAESFDEEFEFITAMGRKRWVRKIGRPIFGDQSEVTKLVGTFQDITQAKYQQTETNAERDLFKLAVEISKLGIWSSTPDNKTTFDKRMRDIYGFDQTEETSPEAVQAKIHDADKPVLEATAEASIRDLKPKNFQYRVFRDQNDMRYIEGNLAPQVDAKTGEFSGFVGVNKDITSQV